MWPLLVLVTAVTVRACPSLCSCSAGTVICTAQQLQHVPSAIPEDTVRLDLQENKIAVIKKDDLSHLKNLKILQLMDNHIHTIEDGAFDGLENLERLRLNKNRLHSLPKGIFKDLHALHRLDLSENYFTTLADEQLQGPKNMRNLQLDRNNLVCLETSVISTWTSLEIFTVNNNNLTTLEEIEFLPNIRNFRIAENPWLCDCRLKWIKRAFMRQSSGGAKCSKPVLLQGKQLDAVEESLLKCSGIEKRATTSCMETRVCPPVCTCTESTVDCRDRGLRHVPTNLPLSTTELRLEQNQISYIPPKAFQNLRNLQRLDLSKNQLLELAPNAFEGLKNLNSLVLYGNNLTDIPIDAFEGLGNLQLLLLNANQIPCLRKKLLDPLVNLNLLSLYDNQIKSISKATFSKLKKLQTLHLAKNPLICDCNLEWLAELNVKANIETSGARCEGPKRVAKKRFTSLHPSKFRCKGSEILVTQKADECVIDSECPSRCSCHGTTVDCSRRELTSIPEGIPSYTTELNLSGNKISGISNESLKSLSRLQKLDLSNNMIQKIDDQLLSDNESLQELNLSGNMLSYVTVLALKGLPKLELLSLANNRLQCVSSGVLNSISNLGNLQLSGNPIKCDCHIVPLLQWLRNNSSRTVHLNDCFDLMGYPKESLERMNCTEDTDLICTEQGDYCPPGCACSGTIVRCSQKELTKFPSGLPPETTELFLDSNRISDIPHGEISRLSKLIKLDMSHNLLESVENHLFSNLTTLSTLILSYNKIRCLQPYSFDGLTSLRILSLHGNDISVLPESAFNSLGNITHIAVGSNSLHCDCRMAWFSRWIKSKFVEAGIARCNSPLSVENQLLLTAHQYQFVCTGDEPKSIASKCNACVLNPCKNEAKCEAVGGTGYRCQCSVGFHGRNCDHQIDACYGHPCLNNAVCKVIQEGRFKCVCPKGFTGDYCERNIDDCNNNKCQNGAKCIDMINTYRCECPERFGGKYCEDKYEMCSKEFNPCNNGAKCISEGSDKYKCECTPGFYGSNCTENKDDCLGHECQNGGICKDGINSYTCACIDGYVGKFCEIPPMMDSFFQNTAQCHSGSCGHGACYTNEDMGDYQCVCREGYTGDKCDQQRSIAFVGKESFAALQPWDAQNGTISFTLRTTNETGLILYYGDEHYLSMELYDGRIKIAFYIGNNPASHMYSYAKVSDGFAHKIQLLLNGKKLTMTVDEQPPQSVSNDGPIEKFEAKKKLFLYVGGVSEKMISAAKKKFHIKSSAGLTGCVSNMVVNDKPVDFSTSIENKNTVAGCSRILDLCAGVYCGNGRCTANSSTTQGFSCTCDQNYEGTHCENRSVSCNKEKYRRHHVEGNCRSAVEIKSAECQGFCGAGESCCAAVKVKKRRVKMLCLDGSSYTSVVNITRKCQCVDSCRKSSLIP